VSPRPNRLAMWRRVGTKRTGGPEGVAGEAVRAAALGWDDAAEETVLLRMPCDAAETGTGAVVEALLRARQAVSAGATGGVATTESEGGIDGTSVERGRGGGVDVTGGGAPETRSESCEGRGGIFGKGRWRSLGGRTLEQLSHRAEEGGLEAGVVPGSRGRGRGGIKRGEP